MPLVSMSSTMKTERPHQSLGNRPLPDADSQEPAVFAVPG